MDDPNSSAIVSLYDPARLQVRVDVPIAEAGRLVVGQPTRISTAMLPGKAFAGRVTRIVGEADLQRNTLQAKVEVVDPDARMRPEVLCRVEFRGSAGDTVGEGGAGGTGSQMLWVPVTALRDATLSEQEVWVVDVLTGRAGKRAVRLGESKRDGYRLVLEGLRANETVVTSGASRLKTGSRVRDESKEETR